MNLDTQKQLYLRLKDQLLAAHPDLAEDEQTLLDTLEGETDFNDVVVSMFEASRRAEDMAAAAGERQTEIGERKARFTARRNSIRKAIARAMLEAGVKKIEDPAVTISARLGAQGLVITDEKVLPKKFMRTKTVEEPDKTAIKEALGAGANVPGAVLSNGEPTITARVK